MEEGKQCAFHTCSDNAIRFFWNDHWCNEHNWYLRLKAKRVFPEYDGNIDDYIAEHKEQ